MTDYRTLSSLISNLFTHPTDRYYASLLAHAAGDLRTQKQACPHYQRAVVWFYQADTGTVSLRTVCRALDLPVDRIQTLAARMEAVLMVDAVHSVNRKEAAYSDTSGI